MLSLAWIATLLALLANILLGLVVFFKNPKSATNVFFAIFSLVLSLYLLFNQLSLEDLDPEIKLSWMRSVMVLGTMMNISYFFFVITFPLTQLDFSYKKAFLSVVYTLFVAVLATTPLLFSAIDVKNNQPVPGPAMVLFLIHTATYLGGGFFSLIKKFRRNSGTIKSQIRLVLIGTITMFILILITNVAFVFVLNNTAFVGLLPLYTTIFIAFTAVAIIKHRFLDIGLLALRAVTYSVLIVLITSFYALFLFAITAHVPKSIQNQMSVAMAILIAFSFDPLKKIIQSLTQKLFYKKAYSPQVLLEELGQILRSNISLTHLTKKVLKELTESMSIAEAAFVITNESGIYATEKIGNEDYFNFDIDSVNLLAQKAKTKPLIFEDIEEGAVKDTLRKFNAVVVVPITIKNIRHGILVLGQKSSGDIFNSSDVQVLEIFTHQLSIAINNSLAYEEIREFNVTLKDEVEKATTKLKAANERLKELDQVKDEFVSIASHELRTPLTSIRNYQWMLLNNKGGKLTDKQRYYTERSYQSTNRLTKLVTDMLNVSRIDSGRLLLDVSKLQLPEMTKDILVELQEKIKEKNIKIIHQQTAEKSLPAVLADADKIKEVIINLIYNALKFTPEKGKIEISYKHEKALVTMMIEDTGIGIDKTYLPSLFTKFGFVKDSLQSNHPSTESTGLGLYISKSIVELHGGKIWAESEGLNQGTTFIFTLPVYSEEQYELLHKRYKKEKDAGLLHNSIS